MVIMHTPHCFPFMRTDSCFVNWVCQATERYLGLGSQCLTLVSQSQRHAADESGIADLVPCEVIPNGLPISRRVCDRDRASLLKELGLPTDCLVVGTVCRLVNYKCVEHFVRAANIVQRHIPRTVFLVAGDGPLRTHLTRLVRRLCLSGHIRFIGYRSDVETILRLLDVCVLCSRAEGMPYVLLEAMVAGVPIVASAVHGNTDLIEDGRTGLLYEFGRVDQLAEKLVHCLADASLRTKLSHEAKHYVLCRHRLDDQVDQMAELYRDLVYQAEMRREKVAQGVHLRTPSAVGGGSYR